MWISGWIDRQMEKYHSHSSLYRHDLKLEILHSSPQIFKQGHSSIWGFIRVYIFSVGENDNSRSFLKIQQVKINSNSSMQWISCALNLRCTCSASVVSHACTAALPLSTACALCSPCTAMLNNPSKRCPKSFCADSRLLYLGILVFLLYVQLSVLITMQ